MHEPPLPTVIDTAKTVHVLHRDYETRSQVTLEIVGPECARARVNQRPRLAERRKHFEWLFLQPIRNPFFDAKLFLALKQNLPCVQFFS
jgi:hypothetical protein